ncbi:DarT ssDNA thymidine ADP-ribosyltransferase family protein [Mucilaginibacter flavus]|uniref:DarT ssDNA thymidine ADP-ribosyltransferase family protein n=1 Tax=Mucilaginibacter flavus TaxID=931504 RepID=UPI0025B40F76|nr:DarT ssDNA thymidine ADP-ribosyltransferase family protein [Mucilaginibacter flavus]MDN3585010.1 DarT ssDNA thymidine ADP-ribosyltransferase family protein [Mucilaginibacter flavus]
MNFIRKLWLRLKLLFSKKTPQQKDFFREQKAILETSFNEFELLQNYSEVKDDASKLLIIDQLAENATSKAILSFYNENNIFLFSRSSHNDLANFRAELLELEKRRLLLNFAMNEISELQYADLSFIDDKIGTMISLGTRNGVGLRDQNKIRIFENPQSAEKLENLLKAHGTLNLHKARLDKKQQQIEVEKGKIKQKLNRLEGAIAQNRLTEAKALISELALEINSTFYKEILRLNQSKQKIRDKELVLIEKAQNEVLRKHLEEVKRHQEIENQRLKTIKVEKDNEDAIKKLLAAEKDSEKEKLKNLLTKKIDWMDFENVCNENSITQLYHFTDRANLKSIKECGGLYSWHYLQRNNIDIPFPGGDIQSRELDRRYNSEDFVRVSFTINHPMMFVAKKQDRIKDPVILKIDREVCFFQETRFSDMNATKTGHKSGSKIEDFKRIRFSLVRHVNHFNLSDEEVKYYQAEVMVKTWIPAESILNINEF